MIQALQLILALSFLVVIHELGHFTFARIFKVRVEKFYMFFNPVGSLVRLKRINGKWQVRFFAKNVPSAMVERTDEMGHPLCDEKGHPLMRPMTEDELNALPEDDWRRYPDNTEWGIGWVPFGGYCAIAGMVDETHAAGELASEPQPWEFRAQNVWKRFCIIIGGVLVNFIGALVIFSAIIGHWGTTRLPMENVDGLYYSQVLLDEGFQQRDRILSVDGQAPEEMADLLQWMIIEGKRNVVVLRAQDTIQLTLSEDLGTRFLAVSQDFDKLEREKERTNKNYHRERYVLLSEYVPFIVDSVVPNTAGDYAHMQKGDRVIAVNGTPALCYFEVRQLLLQHPLDSVHMSVVRGSDTLTLHAFLSDECKLGVGCVTKYTYYPLQHTDYSFFEAIPAGINYGWEQLVNYVKQFRLVFTKEGAQSLGGFGAIGSLFPDVWNWQAFWHMTAWLSLILAFMNIIPIPALDGGYVLMLIWEMITRKKPSDKFLEVANNIGFWLLMALLIFANGNDILKIFF